LYPGLTGSLDRVVEVGLWHLEDPLGCLLLGEPTECEFVPATALDLNGSTRFSDVEARSTPLGLFRRALRASGASL
jgi:hypothetical protein